MAISANNPRLSNQIKSDVPEIQQKEAALLKMDPTNVADLEVGAKRLTEISSGNWQFQMWNGSQWVNVGKLKMDVDTVDGYDASITPKANTVAVRGSDGKLQGSITGNAATADTAVSLSQTLVVGKGGTGATTSEQARANLGVPPTSHASANTTYGLSSESEYGHAKASSDEPAQDTDDGAVGIKVSEFARGDHAHKKVLGTPSVYGQVKLTDSVSDGSAASSSVAASAKAVKEAYDKAYDAANTDMVGATNSVDGSSGNVPAPKKGQQQSFLRGDGSWSDDYLPKSGGKMSGPIELKNKTNDSASLYTLSSSGELQLCSGGKSSEFSERGAVLALYSQNYITSEGKYDNRGGFILQSHYNTKSMGLLGLPNGELSWGGRNILRSINGNFADNNGNINLMTHATGGDNGWIKYSNGIILQWGMLHYNAPIGGGYANLTAYNFNIPFTGTYVVNYTVASGSAGLPCYATTVVRSLTGEQITIFAHNKVSGVSVCWIAIGF